MNYIQSEIDKKYKDQVLGYFLKDIINKAIEKQKIKFCIIQNYVILVKLINTTSYSNKLPEKQKVKTFDTLLNCLVNTRCLELESGKCRNCYEVYKLLQDLAG